MELTRNSARIHIPDGSDRLAALRRTTHLGIGAHPDDLESIAIPGILEAYRSPTAWFSGVTVTAGSGAPRPPELLDLPEEEYAALRAAEQIQAADLGRYSAAVLLGYTSGEARDRACLDIQADLLAVLTATRPDQVFTHNPFDRHPTHTAVCSRVLDAVRQLPPELRPRLLAGLEFWGSLDWLPDRCRLSFDTSAEQGLQQALLDAFPSQNILKAYPAALLGRRAANAVLDQSHQGDTSRGQVFGLDLTPLIKDDGLPLLDYLAGILEEFQAQKLKKARF